jgi:hypothetical protein
VVVLPTPPLWLATVIIIRAYGYACAYTYVHVPKCQKCQETGIKARRGWRIRPGSPCWIKRLHTMLSQRCQIQPRYGSLCYASSTEIVIVRQRPATAKGFLFITLEDETGMSNLIVIPRAS